MIDVSLKKMFPALLTVFCVGLVNVSCSVRTSIPSILSSAQKMMPISKVLGTGATVSIIVLLHPVAVKSFKSVEREFPSSVSFNAVLQVKLEHLVACTIFTMF